MFSFQIITARPRGWLLYAEVVAGDEHAAGLAAPAPTVGQPHSNDSNL